MVTKQDTEGRERGTALAEGRQLRALSSRRRSDAPRQAPWLATVAVKVTESHEARRDSPTGWTIGSSSLRLTTWPKCEEDELTLKLTSPSRKP